MMINYDALRKRKAPISTVNITPFTDVVLVLLIVFMISAPNILNSVLNIQLPGSQSRDTLEKSTSVSVGLDRHGKLYLDRKPISEEDMNAELEKFKKSNDNVSVKLNADEEASHGSVIHVLDMIRKNRITRIYVGTVQK